MEILDADFASEQVITWKAVAGMYHHTFQKGTRWVGVYGHLSGLQQNDRIELTLGGPESKNLISRLWTVGPGQSSDQVFWVAKRRAVLTSWPLGRYEGRFRVIRNGAAILTFSKEMELR